MNKQETLKKLTAVRQELESFTVTGVQAAKSIAGMANVLDSCIADLKEESPNE